MQRNDTNWAFCLEGKDGDEDITIEATNLEWYKNHPEEKYVNLEIWREGRYGESDVHIFLNTYEMAQLKKLLEDALNQ